MFALAGMMRTQWFRGLKRIWIGAAWLDIHRSEGAGPGPVKKTEALGANHRARACREMWGVGVPGWPGGPGPVEKSSKQATAADGSSNVQENSITHPAYNNTFNNGTCTSQCNAALETLETLKIVAIILT